MEAYIKGKDRRRTAILELSKRVQRIKRSNKMKIIGKTNLGNITAGTETTYKFMVVSDDGKPVGSQVKIIPVVTKGKLSINPLKIETDEHSIGECKLYLPIDASGVCRFEMIPVGMGL